MAKIFDSNTEKKSKKINSGLSLKKKNSYLNKESSLLLNRFLNLSAITQLDNLMDATLQEFYTLSQSEHAIVYLSHGSIFKAYNETGLHLDDLQNSEHLKNTVDTDFIHDYMQSVKTSPEVQNGSDLKAAKNNSNSALIFAIAHKGHISGYFYLGHNSKNHEFDSDTTEIFGLLSAQVAISLHNISMIKNVQEKAEFNSEWKAIQAAQESLLPLRNQKIPQMAIAYRYYSASKTGRDWVTYYYNSRCDTVYLCVGKVTRHGFPSALITGVVCGAVFFL